MEKGMPIPVVITVYADRTFTFETKMAPNSYFLKKAAGIEKGSQTTGTNFVGKITKKQIHEIAEKKMRDMNATTIEAAEAILTGSARSMGLEVVE
jgi:large subunit ribosomal protein L11